MATHTADMRHAAAQPPSLDAVSALQSIRRQLHERWTQFHDGGEHSSGLAPQPSASNAPATQTTCSPAEHPPAELFLRPVSSSSGQARVDAGSTTGEQQFKPTATSEGHTSASRVMIHSPDAAATSAPSPVVDSSVIDRLGGERGWSEGNGLCDGSSDVAGSSQQAGPTAPAGVAVAEASGSGYSGLTHRAASLSNGGQQQHTGIAITAAPPASSDAAAAGAAATGGGSAAGSSSSFAASLLAPRSILRQLQGRHALATGGATANGAADASEVQPLLAGEAGRGENGETAAAAAERHRLAESGGIDLRVRG